MERFNTHVSTAQIALEQAPEVLQPVRVNLTAHVLRCVVHNFMHEGFPQVVVGDSRICVDPAPVFDVFQNLVLQGFALDVWDYLGANLAGVTIKHSDDGSLSRPYVTTALLAPHLLQLGSPLFVHLLRRGTDKTFVAFYCTASTAELFHGAVLEHFADAMEHEPCALLGDLQGARHFCAANAILAVADHPESGHPFVHAERGILEDRTDLDGELLLAALAEPHQAGAQKRVLGMAAAWTGDFLSRPAEIHRINKGSLWLCEVGNRLLKASWGFVDIRHFFALSFYLMPEYPKGLCVSSIYLPIKTWEIRHEALSKLL